MVAPRVIPQRDCGEQYLPGSGVGGFLQRPAEQWPAVFRGTVFDTFPFLLPMTVAAALTFTGGIMGRVHHKMASKHHACGIQLKKRGLANALNDVLSNFCRVLNWGLIYLPETASQWRRMEQRRKMKMAGGGGGGVGVTGSGGGRGKISEKEFWKLAMAAKGEGDFRQGLTLVHFSAQPEPFLVIDPAHRHRLSHKTCLR